MMSVKKPTAQDMRVREMLDKVETLRIMYGEQYVTEQLGAALILLAQRHRKQLATHDEAVVTLEKVQDILP